MTSLVVTAAHYVLGWAILTLALSWLAAVIYVYSGSLFARAGTNKNAFYLLLLALLAPVTALVTLFILSSPSWTHLMVAPHCHGNVCEPHSLTFVMESMLSTVMVAMGVAAVVVMGLLMTQQLLSNRHRSQMLEQLAELDDSGYLRLDNAKPIAWCLGMLKPKVLLSSGLVESLTEQQRQIVLARELTHASQYDNLRKWLLRWATIAWPTTLKRAIRSDFASLCESTCDLKAFCALNSAMTADTFIKTLQEVYGSPEPSSWQQGFWRRRLDTLQRELAFEQSASHTGRLQAMALGATAASLWLAIVVGAVFVGHPLLESLPY